MNVIEDSGLFDKLQCALLEEISQTLKRELERHGLTGSAAQRLARDVAFQVCCVVDGSAILEVDGIPVQPVLTFEQPDGSLVTAGGSWMHEYALGNVDLAFGKEPGDF